MSRSIISPPYSDNYEKNQVESPVATNIGFGLYNMFVKMASKLEACPDDILIEIFKSQNSIDDCLQLGRSCRRLYAVLDRNRFIIMKSIIVR